MSTKDWAEKDYYKILGVSKDAKPEEIKKAFRKIARDNHPDSHPGDKAAEARFKEASEANDVLSNVKKRRSTTRLVACSDQQVDSGSRVVERRPASTWRIFYVLPPTGTGSVTCSAISLGLAGDVAQRPGRHVGELTLRGRRRFPSTMPCLGPPSLWTWSLRHPARHVGDWSSGWYRSASVLDLSRVGYAC